MISLAFSQDQISPSVLSFGVFCHQVVNTTIHLYSDSHFLPRLYELFLCLDRSSSTTSVTWLCLNLGQTLCEYRVVILYCVCTHAFVCDVHIVEKRFAN